MPVMLRPENAERWAQSYIENAAYCLKHNLNVGAPLST